MEKIWDDLGHFVHWDIAAAPTIFTTVSDRAALMFLFVAKRDDIPVFLLGDDEVAKLVLQLNDKTSAKLFRRLAVLTGLSRM